MAVQARRPILFGLSGVPLSIGDEELNAATVEEALELAKEAKRTRYLRALELEDSFVILVDAEKAQRQLFEAETAEEAEECLRAGARVTARNYRGWTSLHSASRHGRERVVERLLAGGASVTARSPANWTPLHLASSDGHTAVVEILIAAGADVNTRDHVGQTPLAGVVKRGHPGVVKLLRAAGAVE